MNTCSIYFILICNKNVRAICKLYKTFYTCIKIAFVRTIFRSIRLDFIELNVNAFIKYCRFLFSHICRALSVTVSDHLSWVVWTWTVARTWTMYVIERNGYSSRTFSRSASGRMPDGRSQAPLCCKYKKEIDCALISCRYNLWKISQDVLPLSSNASYQELWVTHS